MIDSRGYPYLAAIKADSDDAQLIRLGEESLLDGGWLSHVDGDISKLRKRFVVVV